MRIYLKNIPAKYHPDPIWDNGVFRGFFNNKKNNKNTASSDMR